MLIQEETQMIKEYDQGITRLGREYNVQYSLPIRPINRQ